MISINQDDIMKNYATFQNILAKTKKDGEVVISKEDVLDREAFVKQIVDLAMVLSEKHKNCCFAIEGEWGSGKSFVLENKNVFSQNNQRKLVLIDSLLFGMTVGNMIIMKSQ